tara:strand:+ start:55 stop:315 length:261 start_codon:yes stop_codon:yes gene_type:complete
MKITQRQLKQLIHEELEQLLIREDNQEAGDLHPELDKDLEEIGWFVGDLQDVQLAKLKDYIDLILRMRAEYPHLQPDPRQVPIPGV